MSAADDFYGSPDPTNPEKSKLSNRAQGTLYRKCLILHQNVERCLIRNTTGKLTLVPSAAAEGACSFDIQALKACRAKADLFLIRKGPKLMQEFSECMLDDSKSAADCTPAFKRLEALTQGAEFDATWRRTRGGADDAKH